MKAIFAIAGRELASLFASPIGWICLGAFTTLGGLFFTLGLGAWYSAYDQMMFNPAQADQMNVNDWVVVPLFGNLGVIALLITPAITMRLLAEDRRQRSIELLLTSPIRSVDIVIGKFLGALAYAACMLATTLPFAWILYRLGDPDTGIVIANYASFFLLTATLMAVGLFTSALTENQVVALSVGFALNLFVWIVGWVGTLVGEGAARSAVEGLSLLTHAEQLGKGLLHVSDIVYFVTFIGFFLFATVQRVEALRWR